ncbi:MAG: hypothetical protein AB1324_01630 [Candidatus Micrarchaeota archaeon]
MAQRDRRQPVRPETLAREAAMKGREIAQRREVQQPSRQIPKKGPATRVVEATVKAEGEVRRGKEVAQAVSSSANAMDQTLRAQQEARAQQPAPRQQAEPQKQPVQQPVQAPQRQDTSQPRQVAETPVVVSSGPQTVRAREEPAPRERPAIPRQERAPRQEQQRPNVFRRMLNSLLSLFRRGARPPPQAQRPREGERQAPRPAIMPVVLGSGKGVAQGAPPPDDPQAYTSENFNTPIDFDTVRISPLDPQVRVQRQLPGLGAAEATDAQRALRENAATLAAYESRVRTFMRDHADAFRPVRRMRAGEQEIAICGPIRMGGAVRDAREDIAVPIFITSGGTTRLVIAYQSQSQGTWRRFAGCDDEHGHYYKGPRADSEHLQDLDWRIQREIDLVLGREQPSVMPAVALREFGPRPADGDGAEELVVAMENAVQSSALNGARALDLSQPGSMPARIREYWLTGSDGDFYGRHAHMVAESADGRFLYGIALTDLGMFLQYVHDREAGGITMSGSPSRGVTIPERDDWIMTPIIEYTMQTGDVLARRLSRVEARKSVLGGGVRSYLVGVHSSSGSPFFQIDNALSPIYPMLRRGDHDRAESVLGEIRSGRMPLVSAERPRQLPADRVMALADQRYAQLRDAYNAHASRSVGDAEIMRQYSVTSRELRVFGRYEEHGREMLAGGPALARYSKKRTMQLAGILAGLQGPIDPQSAEGKELVARERLSAREINALNGLAGSQADQKSQNRALRAAVESDERERISARIAGMVEDRLRWQATLWAQAELAR